nr:WRKY55 [Phoebe bournei]
MEPPSPENSSTNWSKAIRELTRGREFATELQNLLRKAAGDLESETAGELVAKIMQSFVDTISILNSGDSHRNSHDPAITRVGAGGPDENMIKDSEGNMKNPAGKDRRRGYKRRRSSVTWTKITPSPFIDDHGWRKYGQKEILGAKHPRSYFRCTHRNDQGCQATKQVQKMEEDPPNYLITYMGHHTCKDLSRTPQIILDSTTTQPFSLSFDSNCIRKRDPSISSSSFLPIKQEENEEIFKDFTPHNSSSSSSTSEHLMPLDLSMFESCGPVTKLPAIASDEGDVFSRSPTNSYSLDMDIKVDPSEFDEILYFGGEDFF